MNPPPVPLDFWDAYPPELRPTVPLVGLGNGGGLSGSALWRVEAPVGPLSLRAWPFGTTPGRVEQVHRWLAPLARFPWAAVPLAGRTGETARSCSGRIWELNRFLPGQPDLGRPPTPAHLSAMWDVLARVHLALGPSLKLDHSPGLRMRRGELRWLIAGGFATFRSLLDAMPDIDLTKLAYAWLERATAAAPAALMRVEAAAAWRFPLQPVIRDARPDHFLFEGDEMTGLVDFGAMDVDSIAGDLARLLGEMSGAHADLPRPALDAYESVRPLTAEERAAIDAFYAANAVLGGARWVRWHFVQGRRFDEPGAVAAGLTRAIGRLAD